jgi:formamidopyrimidine-DNA glycosylase
MPELPEVEMIRRGLEPVLTGRRIESLEIGKPKLFLVAGELTEADLIGRRVERLLRRAKLLVWDLDGDLALVFHFKLTGQTVYRAADGTTFGAGHPIPPFDAPVPGSMTHLVFTFDDGGTLYLNDQRQFARVRLMRAEAVAPFLEAYRFGPDPFDAALTPDALRERLRARAKMALKPLLLDQTFVAGLGNIYADETLNGAGLHPLRRAGTLDEAESGRLHAAMRSVLDLALRQGGAIVINGRMVPVPGKDFLYVHGRAGQPCLREDGGTVERTVVGQRGTFLCPVCQPAPG